MFWRRFYFVILSVHFQTFKCHCESLTTLIASIFQFRFKLTHSQPCAIVSLFTWSRRTCKLLWFSDTQCSCSVVLKACLLCIQAIDITISWYFVRVYLRCCVILVFILAKNTIFFLSHSFLIFYSILNTLNTSICLCWDTGSCLFWSVLWFCLLSLRKLILETKFKSSEIQFEKFQIVTCSS